jgi:hypothetical protein
MEELKMTIYGAGGGGYRDANRQAAEASNEASAAKLEATELRDQLARMKLACAAVWELLKEKTGLTEDDLATRMAILDAKDGVADGKLTRSIRKCVKCGRTVPAKQNKCMYCSETQPADSIFEGL